MSRTVFYPQCRATLSVVFDGFGAEDEPLVVQTIPQECTVNLNGYKEADTWSLTFDAKSLPFNPDTIRSMAVQIYLFDAGSVNPPVEAFAVSENLLVAGLADNADLSLSGDGRKFTCDGRDYTCLLLDKQWDPRKKVPSGKPLSKAIQFLVDQATGANEHGGRTLVVEYLATGKDEPVVGAVSGKTKKGGVAGKDGDNVWDVIYRTVLREGLICFVRGASVIITDPQTMTLQNASKVAKVAYGRNLESLRVERKLGKEKTPQVVASCYSAKLRKSITARFPEKGATVTTGIGTEKDEVTRISPGNVDSVEKLRQICETYYNNIARGESKITFVTKTLVDLSTRDPFLDKLDQAQGRVRSDGAVSLLQLRAGDPVVIGFDPFNEAMLESLTPAQRYQELLSMGYSGQVAAVVAAEFDRLDQFNRPFYTREVVVTWSVADGVTLDVEAINFVFVDRDDSTAKANPTSAATKTHTAGVPVSEPT